MDISVVLSIRYAVARFVKILDPPGSAIAPSSSEVSRSDLIRQIWVALGNGPFMSPDINNTLDLSAKGGFVLGQGSAIQAVNAMVVDIARTDIAVLLVGESGTGKEVYARLIHRLSGLGGGTLKKVNCAALNAGRLLAEIEVDLLSGSESKAAVPRTVFLDDVHELDAASQRAILALLPDGEPKGYPGRTSSRFISSTSRNLEKEIEAGRFRRELYF